MWCGQKGDRAPQRAPVRTHGDGRLLQACHYWPLGFRKRDLGDAPPVLLYPKSEAAFPKLGVLYDLLNS